MTTVQEQSTSATPTPVQPLLRASGLSVSYVKPRKGTNLGTGAALQNASFEVHPGEIVGIVGETGSGKTTLARAIVGLVAPAAGTIEFEGRDLGALRGRALRDFRREGRIQLVFQDPLRSLDPDLTVARLVAEPLDIAGGLSAAERTARVDEALREVGLQPDSIRDRKPRQLSGGQRQRVSLARAIVTRPKLLFCDEPVSALDVSNRNLVLNLLDRLRRDLGLAVVIIAHDLSSLAGIADRVAVFYRSRLVEQGPTRDVLEQPAHPYTALLVASAPSVSGRHWLRPGDVRADDPARAAWPVEGGCVFADRCRFAVDACRSQPDPTPLADRPDRVAACHLAGSWSRNLKQHKEIA
jgi:oligopeptide/dipeptide ABC transporter ATP-binding protein